jgi:mannose-6-phosphate isomerase-like protein (cupin superfamily)
MRKWIPVLCIGSLISLAMAFSQQPWWVNAVRPEGADWYNLDPSPYDPKSEPDAGMFMRHYNESVMKVTNGCLSVWNILAPLAGDNPVFPKEKAQVTTAIQSLDYAVLDPGRVTNPETLRGIQKIVFINDGKGEISCAGKTDAIETDALALLPERQTYTIRNTGTRPLDMYIITEPVPDGFSPNSDMKILHDSTTPFTATQAHWSHCPKGRFIKSDGLATLTGLAPVWYMPMTIGQPHSHHPGVEEIWLVAEGDFHVLLGKQFYNLRPGTGYKVPPTGTTPHVNMNLGAKPVKTFWLMYNTPQTTDVSRYAELTPKPLDTEVDADIDMYISTHRNHHPFITHGSILERHMFTKSNSESGKPAHSGDVLHHIDRFTHATVMPYHKTEPTTLERTQEVFYVIEGRGKIMTDGESFDLHPGICAFVPAGLAFSIENSGDETLEMYLVAEKVRVGFKPRRSLLVCDEGKTAAGHKTHWTYETSILVDRESGLSQLSFVASVVLPPNSFGQPHSHDANTEEVWATVDSDLVFMLGKQLRRFGPGYAYMVPPDGKTFHSNINPTNRPVRLFHFGLIN